MVDIFKSFLYDRRFFVEHLGFRYDFFVQLPDIPLGSILSSPLIIAFINDIGDPFHKKLAFCADDFNLFASVTELSNCLELQLDLDGLYALCGTNRLFLNLKCRNMHFTRKCYSIRLDYNVGNDVLELVHSITDLGEVFGERLLYSRSFLHFY